MARKNIVSMQNLADELAVSKVTVSKALNGKEGVSAELKKRILAAADKYGYVLPDYGKRKSKKVAIIMSKRFNAGDDGQFYMGMYDCIRKELGRHSCSCVMITPDRNTLTGDLSILENRGSFDGIILLGILEQAVGRYLDDISLPKVYVDVYDVSHRSDSVVTENIYSTYELTDYLFAKGHRNIGFVGTVGAGGTTSIVDRYLGYVRRLMEQGIEPDRNWIISDRDEEGHAIGFDLPKKLPDAFVCNCDETAFRLVRKLRMSGVRVPEDISVVGFDDSIHAKLCDPPLTTVAVDMEKIGKSAAKSVLKVIDYSGRKAGEIIRVPGKIVYRESVSDRTEDGRTGCQE